MNLLRLRFYIELLTISAAIVNLVYVIPMQVIIEGEPRLLTVGIGMILWYIIVSYNETFYVLIEKWFGKK